MIVTEFTVAKATTNNTSAASANTGSCSIHAAINNATDAGVSQLQLFDERPPRPHSAELMKVLDGINNSGLGKVWFAGRGMAPEWQMKREMLSPAYTTRWSDIPAAKLA